MLEIQASKISNVISFTVDHNSLREAKKAGQDLQKYFQSLAEPKLRIKTFKQNQRRAEALSDDAKLKNAVKSSEAKQQRIADKAAKTQAREQAKIAKRNEMADIKFKSAGLQLRGIAGKYKVNPADQYKALKFVQEQTESFRKGLLSSERMNFLIRQRITDLRRESALQAKITASTQAQAAAQRTAKRTDYKGAAAGIKEKGLNVIGATAALAGGAGVLSRIKQKGDQNLDLVRKSALVKTNPAVVQAMVAYGQQHGIDSASVDKVTDNFKDVRERLGESVTNSQFDQKSGKWKGGNGAIDNVMSLFGWTKADIAKFQDRPADFIQATVNEGQRRGMSQSSIGHLIEDYGDDLAHYTDLFLNDGAEFNKVLKQLVDSGQTLNDEQIKQTYAYGDLSVAMANLMNGVDNSLFTGFMKGFADGGDDLVKNTKVITESAGMLGEGLGDLAKQVTGFVGEISGVVSDLNAGLRARFPDWFSDANKPAAQALYDVAVGGSANATADWIYDHTGWNPQSVGPAVTGWAKDWLGLGDHPTGTAIAQYSLNGDSLQGGSLRETAVSSLTHTDSAPAYNLAPVFNLTVAPQVPLTIQSDSSMLSKYIDFQAKASQASFAQSLTLQMLSGQSLTSG
ncbi:TPA: hypothetical protein R9C50_001422 [Escherichia coli]|nr:hypothetical protein [Escherichia coli]